MTGFERKRTVFERNSSTTQRLERIEEPIAEYLVEKVPELHRLRVLNVVREASRVLLFDEFQSQQWAQISAELITTMTTNHVAVNAVKPHVIDEMLSSN